MSLSAYLADNAMPSNPAETTTEQFLTELNTTTDPNHHRNRRGTHHPNSVRQAHPEWSGVPALEVSKPAEPYVARALEQAIQHDQPTLLQRTTDKSIIRQNRAEATRGWDYTKGNLDKFP